MTRRPCLGLTVAAAACTLLAACAVAVRWQDDLPAALTAARRSRQELVVFFALPGRELSDRMQKALDDAVVQQALADGGFAAAIADGIARKNLYAAWVGGGEGMGIAVLDARGDVYAARPGPQDAAELAAFLRLCAGSRDALAVARAEAASADAPAQSKHTLGCLLLQLGCRTQCEAPLLDAAMAGVADARHRLARLYALDGNVAAARRWLAAAPKTGPAQVTEGYVLFKERRHAEAALVLDTALRSGGLGDDRQRAQLYLGKALHEDKQDARAVPILQALAAEGTGTTFEAAARHTLDHIDDPQQGHSH